MNLLVHTKEEFNILCKILDRKNIKYRVKAFELNIEVEECSAIYAHERRESEIQTFNDLSFKTIKNLDVGESFLFGYYKSAPIKWIKVSKYRAISAYILDNMAFGETNDYATSKVREWCNNLGTEYGLCKDSIYIPCEKEILRWFPSKVERKCDYSEEAKSRGIDDGMPRYWTRTKLPSSSWVHYARVVSDSGLFSNSNTYHSHGGVRPIIKF